MKLLQLKAAKNDLFPFQTSFLSAGLTEPISLEKSAVQVKNRKFLYYDTDQRSH